MAIYYARYEWEPFEAYHLCSDHDHKVICVVTNCGDQWELRFFRGARDPGPFPYLTFGKAKKQVLRYLETREHRITGGPPVPNANHAVSSHAHTPSEPLRTTHPSRKPRRKGWWKESAPTSQPADAAQDSNPAVNSA